MTFTGKFEISEDDLRILREMGCEEIEAHRMWERTFESAYVCITCEKFPVGLRWYGVARPLAAERVSASVLRVLLQDLQDKLKRLMVVSSTITASLDAALTASKGLAPKEQDTP